MNYETIIHCLFALFPSNSYCSPFSLFSGQPRSDVSGEGCHIGFRILQGDKQAEEHPVVSGDNEIANRETERERETPRDLFTDEKSRPR